MQRHLMMAHNKRCDFEFAVKGCVHIVERFGDASACWIFLRNKNSGEKYEIHEIMKVLIFGIQC